MAYNPRQMMIEHQHAMLEMANQFVVNAQRLGLHVTLDQPTPGDGNCFYHAVIQQLHRPEISTLVHPEMLTLNHYQLRHLVISYIRQYEINSAYIQDFRILHETIEGNTPWHHFLSLQEIDGTYATTLFIAVTSFLVGVDIHITSDTNTINNPVTIFSHYVNGHIDIAYSGPIILIGSTSQNHFQSLIPLIAPPVLHEAVMDIDFTRTVASEESSGVTNISNDNAIKVDATEKEKIIKEMPRNTKEVYFQQLCKTNSVVYLSPLPEETKKQTRNRRQNMKRNCMKDKTKDKYKKYKVDYKENNLETLCSDRAVPFIAQSINESSEQTRNRRKKLKRECFKKVDQNKCQTEKILQQLCSTNSITYLPPAENESANQTKNRRHNLRKKCSNAKDTVIMGVLNEIVDNVVHQEREDIATQKILDNETIEDVQQNVQSLHSNPKVQQSILMFESGEMDHDVKSCNVCLETRPVFCATGIDPTIPLNPWKLFKDGSCNRCHKDILKRKKLTKKQAAKFSGHFSEEQHLGPIQNIIRHNNMHFLPIPIFLQNLTTVEIALISRITVIMNIHLLKKGGMLSSRGHSISIPQNMKIAKVLPLLPSEVGIVIVKRGNNDLLPSREYNVKRKNVENAIRGLCYGMPEGGTKHAEKNYVKYHGPDHINMPLNNRYFLHAPNYKYNDVIIAQNHIDLLPKTFSQLPGLNVIDCNGEEKEEESDKGPAPAQFEMDLDENDESTTHSCISIPIASKDTDKQLNRILEKFIGQKVPDKRDDNTAVFNWDFNHGEPLNELKTPGFFTMAFPTVFINGSCDMTAQPLIDIEYNEFVEHIYYTGDSRVSRHPYLKFFLFNLGLRKQALSQGSFLVAQQLNDAHLTIKELQENLNNKDESVPRKIISVAANLRNTDPYWRERRKELSGLIIFRNKEFDELPAYFDTNSCAEFHWEPLIEILIKYHSKSNNLDVNSFRNEVQTNSSLKRNLLLHNLHIVTHYFDARTKNYYNTVGKEIFQYNDIWWRYEFAKSRGEIHSHAIICSSKHASKVKNILNKYPVTNDNIANDDKAEDLYKWFQTNEMNDDTTFSPSFVSMHPAGGTHQISSDGENVWNPDKSKWPLPEGTQPPPTTNPLTETIASKVENLQSLHDFHISLLNRVGLHECSSYCLRYYRKKDNNNNKYYSTASKYCRFHFGDQNPDTKEMSGKDLHPNNPIVTLGEHPRYEGPCDHPRMVMHVKTRLLSWLANCDTQGIIDDDLMALLKYVAGYACKGAASTEDYINCYHKLLESSDENCTVRNLTNRLLMKTVGMIDIPAAAADYMNTSGQLYHCNRKFRRIGLSGYRQLNNYAKDDTITKASAFDKFMSAERRQENPLITLWDWAKKCDCYTPCHSDHIPIFTGLPIHPVWPVIEEYALSQLMIFSQGDWTTKEDLMGEFDNYTEAFASFLDSDICPPMLNKMLLSTKEQYDKKKRKEEIQKYFRQDTSSQLSSQSQFSQTSTASDNFLGRLLMQDIARENQLHINEPIQQDVLPDGGPDFDWHDYGMLSFGDVWPVNAKDWLSDISDTAEKEKTRHANDCTLPAINLLSANALQRVIIAINIIKLLSIFKHDKLELAEPLRLLIQGTAGVGKTYVIIALTYITRRLFKKNMSVLNLAPTGAASVLLPDGRTVHSTTPIPRMKKKEFNTAQLQDYPLSDVSFRKLRKLIGYRETKEFDLVCLNLDERGMWAKRLLAWSSQRFKEVTEDLENAFGSVPIVNFFGDLGQLGPINEKDLHVPPLKTDAPDMQAGYALYRSFSDCIVLTETMRQGEDQLQLLSRLLRVRNGSIEQKDWIDINSRYEGDLSDVEKQQFCYGRVLTLMETWAEVNIENHSKLATLNVPVAVLPSKGRGKHHAQTEKQVGQIVPRCLIAVGSRVILTKNQGSLTSFGLNNGAIGKVIAILYEKDSKPPDFPEAIVVDFPNYKGPAWIPEHKTWIPISSVDATCETFCCSRTGFPLMPGYAIPIAKSQGMSIGATKDASHVRIKLQQAKKMEQLSLGTTYTALSRCEKESDWCLVEKIPEDRLLYINDHPHMKGRQFEEQRLKELSRKTLSTYGEYATNFQAYIDLIRELDLFCNDGILDHVLKE